MRFLYTLIIHLFALATELSSFFNRKARMTRLGQWRTNHILRTRIDASAQYIWFHAASLGEFEQGRPMMEIIRKRYPQYKILLTFFSPSGYEVRKNYEGADVICYLPFDTPYKVKKFLNLAHPCMAIFIKYEFWMNYLGELHKRHIPTYLISAIFRRDQLFFRSYGWCYRRVLEYFDRLFVQDEASAQLLGEFGITNVSVCGDTRFDRVIEVRKSVRNFPSLDTFAGDDKRQLLVAGSTWPQDEDIIIPYFNNNPGMKLIIAPHEIHREHLLDIVAKLQRPTLRFSEANEHNVVGIDCLIIDSFGLLSSIYRYGNMAYIGGGFGKGIHNTLEAAVYGIPVVFGPKYRKFKEAVDLITAGGGFVVQNADTFAGLMDNFAAHPEQMREAGTRVGEYVDRNIGVTEKILKEIIK